ncbi:MAG: phage Gp37/Gp68 family protein, partial [Patescibacteria group bacterium]
APLKTKKPTKFFVNSMSDLFHEKMPKKFLNSVFEIIEKTPQHTYQILTKRAESMEKYFKGKNIPQNAWVGVTVENQRVRSRIDCLRNIDAKIRFLSIEPLLEDLGKINLKNIDWVIVGGESGLKARPMKEEWVVNIKKQCEEQGAAFFFKQWGTWGSDGVKRNKKVNGRKLLNKTWSEYPSLILNT